MKMAAATGGNVSNQAMLFACSKCFSRHPFEELSQGQQLCKVRTFLQINWGFKRFEFVFNYRLLEYDYGSFQFSSGFEKNYVSF